VVGGEGIAPLGMGRARVRHGLVFWDGERGFVECVGR
jgi:hypothetical protein